MVTPDGLHLPLALRLDFPATNNAAEYEALIFGLESLVSLGVRRAVVRGDSLLVISQALGTWEVREPALKEYKLKLDQLKGLFEELDFVYVPRSENTWADALASLASCANMSLETPVIVCTRTTPSYQIHMVAEDVEDGKPWFHDIKVYLEKGEFAPGSTVEDQKTIARLATKYFLCGDALYRRSYDGMLLLCVAEGQARKLMEEVHGGTCGPHMNGRMLVKKIMRMGYYWSTMESDCISFARKLEKCQTHADMAGLFRSKRDRAHGAITPICLNPGLPPYQQCVLSTLRTGLHLDD